MFCVPGLIFDGTEGAGSRFYVLRFRSRFGQCRGCWVPFLCLAFPDSFSGGTEGVDVNFHISRLQTRFRRYRGRQVKFSFFALPDSFWALLRASYPDFIFFAPGLMFGGTEGTKSHFYILRSQTYYGRYRGRRVRFSCFALPDSFPAVPRASTPIFMFHAPGTRFRRY
jgi:hypothetical protein